MDLYFAPDGVDVYDTGAPDAEALTSGGATMVFSPDGPPGADAFMDAGFGLSNFTQGLVLQGVGFARVVAATDAASLAVTATPPSAIPQVVDLYVNGTLIGTATWEVGQRLGVIDTGGGRVFARGDLPSFGCPNPLDPSFSHFAITYAGP